MTNFWKKKKKVLRGARVHQKSQYGARSFADYFSAVNKCISNFC